MKMLMDFDEEFMILINSQIKGEQNLFNIDLYVNLTYLIID